MRSIIPAPAGSFTWRRRRAAALTGSCGGQVQSPDVSLTEVMPQVVCGSQFATAVKVSGAGMTPLTIDTLVEGTRLKLPRISLSQSQRSDGSPGAKQDIGLFDGQDPGGKNHVTWQSAADDL